MREIETTLRALEQELLETAVRHQAARVAALLADDFVEIGSSGRLWSKAAIIASLQEEPPIERRMTEFHAARLAPGVALVTYRVERLDPGQAPVVTLRSSLWVQEGPQWRMRFHQGTPSEPRP